MCYQYIAVSFLLRLLTVSASSQQNLNDGQLASVPHVGALWNELGSAIFFRSVKGSESVSVTALVGAKLTGYAYGVMYRDASCTTFEGASATLLNTCVNVRGTFMKVSMTSTEQLGEEFSDDTCTDPLTPEEISSYTTECNSQTEGLQIFVQPSLNSPTTKPFYSIS
jgi:hypothetical protein